MLDIAVFSAKSYDEESLLKANIKYHYGLHFHDFQLTKKTAKVAHNCQVVCAFVNDDLDSDVLHALHQEGVKMIAMRCAGANIPV